MVGHVGKQTDFAALDFSLECMTWHISCFCCYDLVHNVHKQRSFGPIGHRTEFMPNKVTPGGLSPRSWPWPWQATKSVQGEAGRSFLDFFGRH